MKAIDQLDAWRLFLKLNELGSVQKSAEFYGADISEISRKISKLEKELKTPLLDRHSRPFRLTEDGEAIIDLVEDMIQRHEEILERLEKRIDRDSPTIRIMVPATFTLISHSILFEYSEFFPKHKIKVITPVNTEDFRKGLCDIAAFTGNVNLPEAFLVPRGRMIFIPVASPAFVKKYGPIEHPSQLSNLPVGITYGGDKLSHTPFNSLIKGNERCALNIFPKVIWNSPAMVFDSVLAGECLSPGLPLFYCINAFREKKLVPILNGWHRPSQFNYLACHRSRWNISYIRTFMNWFAEKFASKEAKYEQEFATLFGEELLHELMTA